MTELRMEGKADKCSDCAEARIGVRCERKDKHTSQPVSHCTLLEHLLFDLIPSFVLRVDFLCLSLEARIRSIAELADAYSLLDHTTHCFL